LKKFQMGWYSGHNPSSQKVEGKIFEPEAADLPENLLHRVAPSEAYYLENSLCEDRNKMTKQGRQKIGRHQFERL